MTTEPCTVQICTNFNFLARIFSQNQKNRNDQPILAAKSGQTGLVSNLDNFIQFYLAFSQNVVNIILALMSEMNRSNKMLSNAPLTFKIGSVVATLDTVEDHSKMAIYLYDRGSRLDL